MEPKTRSRAAAILYKSTEHLPAKLPPFLRLQPRGQFRTPQGDEKVGRFLNLPRVPRCIEPELGGAFAAVLVLVPAGLSDEEDRYAVPLRERLDIHRGL